MKGVLESVIAKESAEFDSAVGGRSGATDQSASEHQSGGMGRSAAWNRPEFGWSGKSLNHVSLNAKSEIESRLYFLLLFRPLKPKIS